MLRMGFSEALVLLAAGTAGGIFSTVVAIASLVTYPVLLALGVPPLAANMTNTVSLAFTGASSVAASRPELAGQGRRVLRLGVFTALGGAAGAAVLLLTPASTFTAVVPVLIGGASLILLVQPRISLLTPPAVLDTRHRLELGAALFAVAMYIGYFGAAGAAVLLLTPASTFTVVVPVLIGGASLVLLVQPRISLLTPPAVLDPRHRLALGAALFAVAMYIGYFGAAAGVLLLVVLTASISEPLVRVYAI